MLFLCMYPCERRRWFGCRDEFQKAEGDTEECTFADSLQTTFDLEQFFYVSSASNLFVTVDGDVQGCFISVYYFLGQVVGPCA